MRREKMKGIEEVERGRREGKMRRSGEDEGEGEDDRRRRMEGQRVQMDEGKKKVDMKSKIDEGKMQRFSDIFEFIG